MKKLMIMIALVSAVVTAKADCTWSWWLGDDKAKSDVKGCALGLGVERDNVKGAELSVCWSKADRVKSGVLGAIGYSECNTLANGAQVAFVNRAKSAALQFGLICFNETGFLPVFVFFNLDTKQFGGKAK